MTGETTTAQRVHRLTPHGVDHHTDLLAIEEPLEIRLSYVVRGARATKALAVTMRTPGDDLDLVAGFLFAEGIVRRERDLADLRPCGTVAGSTRSNTVRATLSEGVSLDLTKLERFFGMTSACGVCGKTTLAAVVGDGVPDVSGIPAAVDEALVRSLPQRLRRAQPTFEATGGLHATGLVDAAGEIIVTREDVGRHNAMDKAIGHHVRAGCLDLSHLVVVVSGRASFELVHKALRARIPMLVAVGAPSSLAVDLAAAHGMTLVGFTRADRFNVYTGAWRLGLEDGPA